MTLQKQHAETKANRQSGAGAPGHLATLALHRRLEAELESVRRELANAWIGLDPARDFRRCSRHRDAAQQRLHRVIKRLAKGLGKGRK
jgi:hypothetical protein